MSPRWTSTASWEQWPSCWQRYTLLWVAPLFSLSGSICICNDSIAEHRWNRLSVNGTPPQAALADRQSGTGWRCMLSLLIPVSERESREGKAASHSSPRCAIEQHCCVIGFILICDMMLQLLLLKQGTEGSSAKGLHFQPCLISWIVIK